LSSFWRPAPPFPAGSSHRDPPNYFMNYYMSSALLLRLFRLDQDSADFARDLNVFPCLDNKS